MAAEVDSIVDHVAALTDPLTEWLAGQDAAGAETTVEHLTRPLVVGLALMHRLNGADPLGWRPVQLAEALDRLDPDEADERSVVGALLLYSRFLADTGRWAADEADLSFSLQLLDAEIGAGDPAALSPDDEADQLRRIDAVDQVVTLVDWIGAGRPLTATGALKLADVVEISALLGEPVATSAATRADDEPVVRSMWQAPSLSLAWIAAQDAGLLEESARGVSVSAAGADLHAEDDELRRQALRQTVSSYVLTMLDALPAADQESDDVVVAAVVAAIGQSITGNPVARSDVQAAVGGDPAAVDDEIDSWLACGLLEEGDGDLLEVPLAARPGVVAGLLAWGAAPHDLPLPTQA